MKPHRYPKQEQRCDACSGYGRVAVVNNAPRAFRHIVGVPLRCTFAEAKQTLTAYGAENATMMSFVVRMFLSALDTTSCPWCSATGVMYAIRQLTPEEAAEIRAREMDET